MGDANGEVYVPAPSPRVTKPRARRDVVLLAAILGVGGVVGFALGAGAWLEREALMDLPARSSTCDAYLADPPVQPHRATLSGCVLDVRHWMGLEYNDRLVEVCGLLWGGPAGPAATSVVLCTDDRGIREQVTSRADLVPDYIDMPRVDGYGNLPSRFSDPTPREVAHEFQEIDAPTLFLTGPPSFAFPLAAALCGAAAFAVMIAWLAINFRRRRSYEAAIARTDAHRDVPRS